MHGRYYISKFFKVWRVDIVIYEELPNDELFTDDSTDDSFTQKKVVFL